MTNKREINTYAILDIETTGLPEYSSFKTNITEISINALSKKDIRNAKNCEIPRVNHKLTMLFNPMKQIDVSATELSGLDNYLLENESRFDEKSANVLILFLERLQQPVCLVAHNGNSFDFPIIKIALEKLKKELPSNIECIDSLPAIQCIDRFRVPSISYKNDNLKINEQLQNDKIKVNDQSHNNLTMIDQLEETIQAGSSASSQANIPDLRTVLSNENKVDWQKINENTPKRQKICISQVKLPRADIEYSRPPSIKSRRELFPASTQLSVPYKPTKFNGYYKLGTMYERIFNVEPKDAHHAEADVECLLKILLYYGNSFVEYSEQNAIPFSNIQLCKFRKFISN